LQQLPATNLLHLQQTLAIQHGHEAMQRSMLQDYGFYLEACADAEISIDYDKICTSCVHKGMSNANFCTINPLTKQHNLHGEQRRSYAKDTPYKPPHLNLVSTSSHDNTPARRPNPYTSCSSHQRNQLHQIFESATVPAYLQRQNYKSTDEALLWDWNPTRPYNWTCQCWHIDFPVHLRYVLHLHPPR